MTANEVKGRILEIVANYDRGIFTKRDMERELWVLAVSVDTQEREEKLGRPA
jgi:hypothetical protein